MAAMGDPQLRDLLRFFGRTSVVALRRLSVFVVGVMSADEGNTLERLLGTGWELSVFRENGRLLIGIPVDCGHWSKGFDFEASESDYEVLRQDIYRWKTLEFILHERLQQRMGNNDYENIEDEAHAVIRRILHGSGDDVEHEISVSPNATFIRIQLQKAGLGKE
ncbi:hypothetical protein [Ensifer adhaerens]|uniref:hypothetical protein n=1 Tax=Ensifer adhaerens TaxID=106592 RepID=UPI00131A35C2|nr:hypothetical protein [Ensifer adhaerens]